MLSEIELRYRVYPEFLIVRYQHPLNLSFNKNPTLNFNDSLAYLMNFLNISNLTNNEGT